MAFINDGLSDEEQKKQGISTQAPPGKKRSLIVIFIWSFLLFILPYGASLMIFGFGQSERSDVGDGALLWMEKALLHVGFGGVSVSFSRCWEYRVSFFLVP
jgi:ABC-type transport system involved in multi-copper enzyme maturation permease subunit